MKNEIFIFVAIDTTGNNLCKDEIISIGSSLINNPDDFFNLYLRPKKKRYLERKLLRGITMAELEKEGISQEEGLKKFQRWVYEMENKYYSTEPIAVINKYQTVEFLKKSFIEYNLRYPFGGEIDLKSYYFGKIGSEIYFRDILSFDREEFNSIKDFSENQAKICKEFFENNIK